LGDCPTIGFAGFVSVFDCFRRSYMPTMKIVTGSKKLDKQVVTFVGAVDDERLPG
jgi:hypothetical protein